MRLVYFRSMKGSLPREQNYSVGERETLAIICMASILEYLQHAFDKSALNALELALQLHIVR